MKSEERIAIAAIYIVLVFTLCAVMGFFLWRFWLFRTHAQLHQRHFFIPLAVEVFLLAFVGVQGITAALAFATNLSAGLVFVHTPIWALSYFGAFIGLGWRVWAFYFDTLLFRLHHDQLWQQLINPTAEQSWVLRNIRTYGSVRWMGKRLLVLYLFVCLVYLILAMQDVNHDNAYHIASYSFLVMVTAIGIVFVGFLWVEIPHKEEVTDMFAMQRELRWALLVGGFTAIVFIPFMAIKGGIHTAPYFIIKATLQIAGAFAISIIQTWCVLHWCNMRNPRSRDTVILQRTRKLIDERRRPEFPKAMADYEVFNLFVGHLMKEFSIENLLCPMELNQFAELILFTVEADKRDRFMEKHESCLQFLRRAPDSAIVWGDNGDLEYKFMLLYEKYVMVGAAMEVNLPSGMRQQWRAFSNTFISDYGGDGKEAVSTLMERGVMVSPGMEEQGTAGGGVHVSAGGGGGGGTAWGDGPFAPTNWGMSSPGPHQPDIAAAFQDDVESPRRQRFDKHGYLLEDDEPSDEDFKYQVGGNEQEDPPMLFTSRVAPLFSDEKMEKLYYTQLLSLLDVVMTECYKLMLDSYSRFSPSGVVAVKLEKWAKRKRGKRRQYN